jgi:hypothetical protein
MCHRKTVDGSDYPYNTSNHQSGADTDCSRCHQREGGDNSEPAYHSANVSKAGGPDCVSCHDTGKSYAYVDVSAMNQSGTSIHADINNASTGTGGSTGNPDNQICWGCHIVNGLYEGGHYNKDPAYACYDCHNGTAAYSNVSNAPKVSQHFKYGDEINASNDSVSINASCIECHNLPEMKNVFNEDDSGYSGNGSYSNVSHYGKNRTSELASAGVTSCAYCHQNSTTAFTGAMDVNATYHSDMRNHTPRSGGPSCTNSTCHDSGRIHASALTKPSTMFNDSYCQDCHTDREQHAAFNLTGVDDQNDINCTDCHADWQSNEKQIHGINASYLQQDGSSYGVNTSAANCTSCHQGTTISSVAQDTLALQSQR